MSIQKELKTLAYVLRRTNYGEADRILNLITPDGKISAIAKGVRREKSKLAGGIEMFSLVELNIHFGKSDMGVVTSTKMIKYYSQIVADLKKMELAALVLKRANVVAENSDGGLCFKIVDQCLKGLNDGYDILLVESWALMNLMLASGSEINLYRDANGDKLLADERYHWDNNELVFVSDIDGEYGSNEIKILRLMATSDLKVLARIKNTTDMMPKILRLIKNVNEILQ